MMSAAEAAKEKERTFMRRPAGMENWGEKSNIERSRGASWSGTVSPDAAQARCIFPRNSLRGLPMAVLPNEGFGAGSQLGKRDSDDMITASDLIGTWEFSRPGEGSGQAFLHFSYTR